MSTSCARYHAWFDRQRSEQQGAKRPILFVEIPLLSKLFPGMDKTPKQLKKNFPSKILWQMMMSWQMMVKPESCNVF